LQKTTELPKIAIGYGSCSDLYVRAVSFLNYTDHLKKSKLEEFNVDEITTKEEFLQSFAYYFQRGAASE
jgi:ADP-dependent glucokinase